MGESLAIISAVSTVFGGISSAFGSMQSGNAAQAAANYNSQVAANNAKIAQQNATLAAQAGEQQVGEQTQKTRATVGAIKAAQAANNLDVNSGSAVDVRSSAAELGELSALNIRSNAARVSYGYSTQESSFKSQSELDKLEGQQSSIAGEVGAAGSVLGGFGDAGLNFSKFLQNSSKTISPLGA